MKILNKKFFKKNKSAFTLVELIIVVTILGILATIAFISFQSYSKNARDGNRITTMKNISKGLEIYKIQTGNYPKPDNSFNVEASGTLIGYQGIIGDSLSRLINISKTPTDPFDSSNYIYSINSDNSKYQILGYLETSDYLSLLNQSYAAVDYSNRYVKTLGDKVGVILDTNKSPISGVTKVDVATGSTTYNVYFGDNDSVVGSGSTILSSMTTRRVDLQNNKNIASLDDSLVGYWDMETLSGGKLRDFSKYGNDGTLSGSISIGGIDGKNGKATYFDGIDDFVYLNNDLINSGSFSISINLKLNEVRIFNEIISKGGTNWDYRLLIEDPNGINSYDAKPCFYIRKDTTNWTFKCGDNFNINDFFHILGVYTGNSMILYLNGKIINSGNINYSQSNNGSIYEIGRYIQGKNRYLKGIIDEVRIYNRALSDSEVQSLYNSTK